MDAIKEAMIRREDEMGPVPMCRYCLKSPSEIEEYVEAAKDNDMTPNDYVRSEEGTYNQANGHFACTSCYVAIGMPSAPGKGWVAP